MGRKKIVMALCLLLVLLAVVQPTEAKKFNAKEAKKKVVVTYKQTTNGILVIYKNKNKEALQLSATMHFKASNKKDISKETQTNFCLGGKSTGTMFFQAPLDEYGNYINYSSFKSSFTISKSKYKSYAKKIIISSELRAVDANVAAINTSGKKLSKINATIVFFNGYGDVIACKVKTLGCQSPNSVVQESVDYVREAEVPVKVKVYVNYAY